MTDRLLRAAPSAAAAVLTQIQQLEQLPRALVVNSKGLGMELLKQNATEKIASYATSTKVAGRFSSQIQLAANDLAWELTA